MEVTVHQSVHVASEVVSVRYSGEPDQARLLIANGWLAGSDIGFTKTGGGDSILRGHLPTGELVYPGDVVVMHEDWTTEVYEKDVWDQTWEDHAEIRVLSDGNDTPATDWSAIPDGINRDAVQLEDLQSSVGVPGDTPDLVEPLVQPTSGDGTPVLDNVVSTEETPESPTPAPADAPGPAEGPTALTSDQDKVGGDTALMSDQPEGPSALTDDQAKTEVEPVEATGPEAAPLAESKEGATEADSAQPVDQVVGDSTEPTDAKAEVTDATVVEPVTEPEAESEGPPVMEDPTTLAQPQATDSAPGSVS